MFRVGRYVDRIVGRRAERDRCSPLGACEGAPGVTENTRHNAIADRRLIVPPVGLGAIEESAQIGQCGRFVFVAPQLLEGTVVVLERCAKRLDRQREDLFDQERAALCRQRCIGDQSGRAWRAIDQRSPLLDLQVKPSGELRKEWIQRQDLAGPALS